MKGDKEMREDIRKVLNDTLTAEQKVTGEGRDSRVDYVVRGKERAVRKIVALLERAS